MNWRWIPSFMGLLTGSLLLYLFFTVEHQPWESFDKIMSIVFSAMCGAVAAGMTYGFMGDTRYAIRQDELKKPFGQERVRVLERKWHLQDLKEKLSYPRELNGAIEACDEQLRRIDKAIIEIYAHQHNPDDQQDIERVEEVARYTKEDVEKMLHAHLPTPQRTRA